MEKGGAANRDESMGVKVRALARRVKGEGGWGAGGIVLPSLSERESLPFGGVSAKAADIWPDGRRPSSVRAQHGHGARSPARRPGLMCCRRLSSPPGSLRNYTSTLVYGQICKGGANNQPQGRCSVGIFTMSSSHLQRQTAR